MFAWFLTFLCYRLPRCTLPITFYIGLMRIIYILFVFLQKYAVLGCKLRAKYKNVHADMRFHPDMYQTGRIQWLQWNIHLSSYFLTLFKKQKIKTGEKLKSISSPALFTRVTHVHPRYSPPLFTRETMFHPRYSPAWQCFTPVTHLVTIQVTGGVWKNFGDPKSMRI